MNTSDPQLMSFQLFDDHIVVMSESQTMSEHINCFLGNLAVQQIGMQEAAFRIAIFTAPKRRMILCSPETGTAKIAGLGRPAWIAFRRLFLSMVVNAERPVYVMHASCVADGTGRAAVITGGTNAGKTSLLVALLQRGFRQVCDDYAVLRLSDGKVLAMPLGVTAPSGTFDLFPELGSLKVEACKFYCERQWQWTINLSHLYPAAPAYSPFEPTHFYSLASDFGGESSICECGPSEAVWWLQEGRLGSLHHIRPLSAYPLSYRERCCALAGNLADRARFFRLINGNINETADLVSEAFAE